MDYYKTWYETLCDAITTLQSSHLQIKFFHLFHSQYYTYNTLYLPEKDYLEKWSWVWKLSLHFLLQDSENTYEKTELKITIKMSIFG